MSKLILVSYADIDVFKDRAKETLVEGLLPLEIKGMVIVYVNPRSGWHKPQVYLQFRDGDELHSWKATGPAQQEEGDAWEWGKDFLWPLQVAIERIGLRYVDAYYPHPLLKDSVGISYEAYLSVLVTRHW